MNDSNDERLRALLRSVIDPVSDSELKRDLWPRMLAKLDERSVRATWLDWALIALLPIWFFLFPESILALIYHL